MRLNFGDHLGFQSFVLFLAGVFLVALAVMNAPFFFEHPKARGFVDLLGRDGSRIVCGGFGAFLVGLAWWVRLAFR
jgi:hypothetical protein